MASQLRFGSVRAFVIFFGVLLVVGILAALDKSFPTVNYVVESGILGFFLIGSAVILIRMWRRRGSPDKFWKSAHGGQIAFLPPTWRRWVLGEDDPRKASRNR
jgi:hypothetical protein